MIFENVNIEISNRSIGLSLSSLSKRSLNQFWSIAAIVAIDGYCRDYMYLQRKGCPMGSHFAPPFSIITLHKIKFQASDILDKEFHARPQLYTRFIDDTCVTCV